MADSFTAIVLWLFVINLGIAFGAGLSRRASSCRRGSANRSGSTLRWNAEAARSADVGLRFWVYVTTIPLTLLTLCSIGAAWWTPEPVRWWWLVAAAATLVDRVMTFGYFIPTMLRLMRPGALSETAAASTASQWVSLGYVRHAATLVAWLAALRALSLLSAT